MTTPTHQSAWRNHWILPDGLADLLPTQARQLEALRRRLLDAAASYGYELVMPPLMEYLDGLLTGTGQALDLQTFKLIDQSTGRLLGIRADTTPQVARIDAHLLNRAGATRLTYCGSVLHTQALHSHNAYSSREPLQFGAELYGHAGLAADVEIIGLALDCAAQTFPTQTLTLDLNHTGLVTALLKEIPHAEHGGILAALGRKDLPSLAQDYAAYPALHALAQLYGGEAVLAKAAHTLPAQPEIRAALQVLADTCSAVKAHHPEVTIHLDLADLSGYAYYTGVRFAVLGSHAVLARGGRYDHVGEAFGRARPAVGFSLDVKEWAQQLQPLPARAAIKVAASAPGAATAASLHAAVRKLRQQGETVVMAMATQEATAGLTTATATATAIASVVHEADEYAFDRELVYAAGRWVVQSLAA